MAWARIQPQGRVRINRGNPLARGLVALFDTRQAREVISGDAATNRSSLAATTPRGIAADFSGTANQQYAHRPAYATTGDFSVVVFCEIRSLSNFGALVAKQASSTTYSPYELRVGRLQTDSQIALLRASSANQRTLVTGTDRFSAGFVGTIIATAPAGAYSAALGANAYVNGVKFPLSTEFGGGDSVPADNGSPIWIGRRYDGATQLDGRIYYVALFNRVLSDAEAASINSNPWQLFDGQAPMLYAASAPAVVNGSATPSGVSASSAVGSAAASGQGRAAPAGVSAAASVGTASAAGAANKLVSGVSATSSVGTVTAAGTVVVNGTATPAGVSATASVGSVSASGATVVHGNASAAGVAAASAGGSVAANGTAVAAANGVQAAAAVGTVSANGGVSVAGNAQPAGVSAVASVGTPSASGATVTHGNAAAAGVAAVASVGSVTVSASARAMPAGVSVLATIGQPIAAGQIQVSGNALPGGVIAYAYVGSVTAGSVTFTSAPSGNGYSRAFSNTTRPTQQDTKRP